MKRSEILFGILKIPMDFTMTVLAFTAAYQLRLFTENLDGFAQPIDHSVLPTTKEYLEFSTYAAIALIVIFALRKMYSLKTTSTLSKEITKTIISWLIWTMAMITYFYAIRIFPFSRLAIGYSWGLALTCILCGRALIKIIQNTLLRTNIGQYSLLFIGNNSVTKEIIQKLENNPSYKILGIVGDKKTTCPTKFLGAIKRLPYLIKKHHIDEIIQTKADTTETQNKDILQLCDLHHIDYRFSPDILDVRRTNIEVEMISGIPIIAIKKTPLDGWGKVTKRTFDIIGSLLGLILLSPILLLTIIAIKIDSKGPILFTKSDDGSTIKRVGKHRHPFVCYKFRSMKQNSHGLRYTKLAKKNTRKDGPLVKIKDDPRVTRVGKFIRKYTIDELPQLWNVLNGNMSLVGPRPHLPEEVAKYEKHHKFVFNIKPGMSGLAQISGRSNLTFEDEAKLDRYYIENWSLWLDIKITFKTIGVILSGHQE